MVIISGAAGDGTGPTWTPSPQSRSSSRLGHFMDWLAETRGLRHDSYDALWRWSVTDLGAFWGAMWDYLDVVSDGDPGEVLAAGDMPGARWFAGTALNWAEHVLRPGAEDETCLIAESQTRPALTMTHGELRSEVARASAGLRRLGVRRGDRVFAYLPNIPEAVIALLATASIGAIWAASPPEFGTQSVLDRAALVDPTVLLVVDGYRYGDKAIQRVDEIATIREALPGLKATVVVPYLDEASAKAIPDATSWAELREFEEPMKFERVPFENPLWILFSSGTTGPPKAIVHGHGGIVLEHFKISALMQDLGPGDVYLSFATTGWMVWNRLVSALISGARILLMDGNPGFPKLGELFAAIERNGVTIWGASSAYLALCQRAGLNPGADHDLSSLRTLIAAGSSCPVEVYGFVEHSVKAGLLFYEGSGGTDVCTGFVSGTPLTPVVPGEIPARMLGVLAEAYDDDGRAVIDTPGELVITEPMPSMPVGFWNDPDGRAYRDAYFDVWPGVWRHGDRFVLTASGSSRILGRSDATLNRGGVRLGSGEFYTVVESFPEVQDSLVTHIEHSDGGELVLFVELRDEQELTDELRRRIGAELRRQRSPRHVPDRIEQVSSIPRTNSGKKLEVPVKKVLSGADPAAVASLGSMANPDALLEFAALATRRHSSQPAG